MFDLGSTAEDACWSPYSSTVVACITSKGRIHVYDLNIRFHKPLCSQRIVSQRRANLTKLTFSFDHPVLLAGDDK